MIYFRCFTILTIFLFPYLLKGQALFEPDYSIPLENAQGASAMTWLGGLNSVQYNMADLTGDNKAEWILYDRSANLFLVFEIVQGTPVIRPALVGLLPEMKQGWVLFIDYNGDGLKDIFTNGDRGVVVYQNITVGAEVSWKKVADPLTTTGFSGKINLIANAADVPGIVDMDDDGDFDIIVYNFAIGGYIRFNKNLSMELYQRPDSLEFEITTREWGGFEECDCDLFAFYPETCSDVDGGRVLHAGGKALLAIDLDGDMDKDVLVGHEQCEELYLFENYGTPDSAFMADYSGFFPDSINPANFHIFPAGFYEDLDFDGVKDLVVSPNTEVNIEYKTDFAHSNYFYKNTGSDDLPEFQYVKSDIIQEHMLDLGENSVPWLADYDGDGDVDLFVASNGYYNGERYTGYISLFENTGTASEPKFKLVDGDYLNLSALSLHDPRMNLVDFNNDGAKDLVFTGVEFNSFNYTSYLMLNTAGPGEAFLFNTDGRRPLTLPMTMSDNPEFFDMDGDGLVDLLLGKQNGALEWYRNTGMVGSEDFELVDGEYLGIGRDFTLERINLVARVADIDQNGSPDLITTDYRGLASIYFDFQEEGKAGDAMPIEVVFENDITGERQPITIDQRSWLASGNIFNDGNECIVVGGARGGIRVLKNLEPGAGPDNGGDAIVMKIYPNPVTSEQLLTIRSNSNVQVHIVDVLGRLVREPLPARKFVPYRLSMSHLTAGIYIIKAIDDKGNVSSLRLMVER